MTYQEIKEVLKRNGIKEDTFKKRVTKYGWSVTDAMNTPPLRPDERKNRIMGERPSEQELKELSKTMSIIALAEHYQVSHPTITKWLREAGIKKTRPELSEDILSEIRKLVILGKHKKIIAEKLDISLCSVYKYIHKLGLDKEYLIKYEKKEKSLDNKRKCSCCKEFKSVDRFYKPPGVDFYESYCKECRKIYLHNYYRARKELNSNV